MRSLCGCVWLSGNVAELIAAQRLVDDADLVLR